MVSDESEDGRNLGGLIDASQDIHAATSNLYMRNMVRHAEITGGCGTSGNAHYGGGRKTRKADGCHRPNENKMSDGG